MVRGPEPREHKLGVTGDAEAPKSEMTLERGQLGVR